MADFAPVNKDHSVSSVSFYIDLSAPIPADALQRAAGEGKGQLPWIEALPAVSFQPGFMFNGPGAPAPFPMIGGVAQFAYLMPNGEAVWVLRLTGSQIYVECSRYSRWAEVWGQSYQFLQQAFKLVTSTQPDVTIIQFSHQIADQFVGADDNYSIEAAVSLEVLPSILRGVASRLWHDASGWFEEQGDFRVLQNVNVAVTGQAAPARRTQGAPYTLTITHLQQGTPLREGDTFLAVDNLDGLAASMHVRNKAVVGTLLNPDMASKIGLSSE